MGTAPRAHLTHRRFAEHQDQCLLPLGAAGGGDVVTAPEEEKEEQKGDGGAVRFTEMTLFRTN